MLCAAKFTQHVISARRLATHPLLRTRDTMLDIRSRAPIVSNKSALIKEKWKHALNPQTVYSNDLAITQDSRSLSRAASNIINTTKYTSNTAKYTPKSSLYYSKSISEVSSSFMPSISTKRAYIVALRALISPSTAISSISTQNKLILPFRTSSRIQQYLTAICLVLQ